MRVCERARFGERGREIESELESVEDVCMHRVVTFVAGSPRTCAFSQDTNPPAGSTASSSCILLAICAPRVRGSSVAHTENWRNRQRGNLGWTDGCMDGRPRGPGYVQWASSRFKPVVVVLCGCTTKTTVGGESLCARLCVLAASPSAIFP